MKISSHKESRIVSLLTALVLLALMVACYAQVIPIPASGSAQHNGQVLEQNAPPTPSLATIVMPPDAQALSNTVHPRRQSDYPELDRTLARIVEAPNPLDLAQQLRLAIKDDSIQVLLILDREDTSFLQNFSVEIGTQSGTKVQAFVPIDQLCILANTDAVLAIRLPDQAVLP